jgi:Chlorophyll A-B binding protein
MLGFVIAIVNEVATGKSVTGQLFDEVVQKSTKVITHSVDGLALSSFAFVVVAVTMGTLAPMINGEENGKRSGLGPFTPEAEMRNSRAAMIGFAALLATEAIKGSALF